MQSQGPVGKQFDLQTLVGVVLVWLNRFLGGGLFFRMVVQKNKRKQEGLFLPTRNFWALVWRILKNGYFFSEEKNVLL